MKILFIRTPRYQWPFHSEHSSFWQPLGFCSMAAVLRKNIDDIKIKIIDCPAERIGWKSARTILIRERPNILCVGEETVSAHEALRLVKFVKTNLPDTVIIAGGVFFSYMTTLMLNHPIDFIVKGEGEITLLELVKELMSKNPDFKKIKGIAFKKKGVIITTPPRKLLDMDALPMPAYDLLNMRSYGKKSSNHPNFTAIEHGRGCVGNCNFCILWKHMGEHKNNSVIPCYRTKSVQKTIDEVLHLYEKYKRKTFLWVDPTWNVNQKWNQEFADALIDSGIDTNHNLWLRADFIVRDEQKGIMNKIAKAGMAQAMVGIERTDKDELAYLNKTNYSFETTKKAFKILKKYPDVLTIATYIYGLPDETKKSMHTFWNQLKEIPFDFGLPVPLTPNPGTDLYTELDKKGPYLMGLSNIFYITSLMCKLKRNIIIQVISAALW